VKGKMPRTKIFSLILVSLIITMAFMNLQGAAKAGDGWKAFKFTGGQSFTYALEMEEEGKKSSGYAGISFSDAGGGMLEVTIEGEFNGVSFRTSAQGAKDDGTDIHGNVVMALFKEDLGFYIPQIILCTIWFPWWETPCYEENFHLGWELIDEDGEYYAKVVEKKSYAGIEGYLLQVGDGEEDLLNFCAAAHLSLPLMVRMVSGTMDEKYVYIAELTSYKEQ